MRIAILLTGVLRTIKKTMRYVKENLVSAMTRAGHDPVFFICVQQGPSTQHIINAEWQTWFEQELPHQIASFQWFEPNDEWQTLRERLLQSIAVSDEWKPYLRHSGSMIEYYQLYLASLELYRWEIHHGCVDYIVRTRTDSIYAKPVDFHWLTWTSSQIQERMDRIQQDIPSTSDPLTHFMTTVLSEDSIPHIWAECSDYPESKKPSWDAEQIRVYLMEGRYLLTFRKNNLYIVKRDFFHFLPSLGTMYGSFRAPTADAYWFNAEGQFRSVCYFSSLTVYDYNSALEDRSVEAVSWKASDFFDEEGNLLHPTMLYCVVRS
jgi:hypothetical protein